MCRNPSPVFFSSNLCLTKHGICTDSQSFDEYEDALRDIGSLKYWLAISAASVLSGEALASGKESDRAPPTKEQPID